MDIKQSLEILALNFWGRAANEAELLAMQGELERDVKAIAASDLGREGMLFHVEPAHFEGLLIAKDK